MTSQSDGLEPPRPLPLERPAETIPKTDSLTLYLSQELYPLSIVQRACYFLADRYDTWIDKLGGRLTVAMRPQAGVLDPEQAQRDLGRALVDFALRDRIAEETRTIRAALVQAALFPVLGKAPTEAPPQGGSPPGPSTAP